jgi:tyrosinase
MRERKNVYKLPVGDTTLEWYAKAVIEMRKRPTTDPRSWNYQAAMHGFNATLAPWHGAAPLPSPADQLSFWNQCQHGSWFFLPWHRMYLAYFEEIVAQTIVDLGGPANWTLPFWNYSDTTNPNARTIPPAFVSPASNVNPLWMPGRRNTIEPRYVLLKALNTIPYTGDGVTSILGFGGPKTPFSHSGRTHGQLESLPHDVVHGSIGGAMGDPRTAALDPIFWLHHANIDRLWQVWLNMGNRINPTESSWLNLSFDFHDKNANTVEMKSIEVEDTRKVLSGYTYEGVPPGLPLMEHANAAKMLDFSQPLEVVAATNNNLSLSSVKTRVSLKLAPSRRQKLNFATTNSEEALTAKPQTTFLHFENVVGKGVPPIHDVYINVPEEDGDKEVYYAGSISFFGVEEASIPSAHHSGSGQHYALDISELIYKLRSLPSWQEEQLNVSIEPSWDMEESANVSIGRISLYSE